MAEDNVMTNSINIEVAYALPDKQRIVALSVEKGCSPLEAVERSKIAELFPGVDMTDAKLGVFGKAIKPDSYVLRPGDRIEVYRPLLVDPKEVRKKRAEKAKQSALT